MAEEFFWQYVIMLVGGSTPTPPITTPLRRFIMSKLGLKVGELHVAAKL